MHSDALFWRMEDVLMLALGDVCPKAKIAKHSERSFDSLMHEEFSAAKPDRPHVGTPKAC
jgi:hypothetical protein